jgi:acetyltransferase
VPIAIDVVAGYALHEPDAFDPVAAVDEAAPRVPVVLAIGGAGPRAEAARDALRRRGIPAPTDAGGVAAAVGALLADAAARARAGTLPDASESGPAPTLGDRAAAESRSGTGTEGRPGDPLARAGVEVGAGPWDEAEAKRIVAALGVAVPAHRSCADRPSAQAALAELDGPVAVKILDATVLHKTELGGVLLGVRTPEQLDDALAALELAGARRVLVEQMAPDGVDLVVGARRDPVFGPVVVLGLGGTVAEALADVAVRVAPVHAEDAAAMVDDLVGRPLLDGWRGGPAVDRQSLGRFVAALGELLVAHPQVSDIEVNPLRITGDGLIALDAVILTAPTAAE